jgi:hypothetical protein
LLNRPLANGPILRTAAQPVDTFTNQNFIGFRCAIAIDEKSATHFNVIGCRARRRSVDNPNIRYQSRRSGQRLFGPVNRAAKHARVALVEAAKLHAAVTTAVEEDVQLTLTIAS